MKRGLSPIVSIVFILVVVITAAVLFRMWYLSEAQHGQLTIGELSNDEGTRALEDLVVENCDGTSMWVKNANVNDVFIRKNGVFVASLYKNNAEVNWTSVVLTPASADPQNYVLHPGQIVKMDLSGAGGIPLGQNIRLSTENRRSLYFSYSIGAVIVTASPSDIWANDGDDNTLADRSIITAFVSDSFGNPVTAAAGYPVVSFYVDNGTMQNPTGISGGKATAEYRSTSYTTAEIESVEGVWYHYDHAMVTASVAETADGTAGGTVIRTVRGSVGVDFKAIVHAYGNYPTATGAAIDANGILNRYGDATSADSRLRYHDGQRIYQISYDESAARSSGSAFPATQAAGQWIEIQFVQGVNGAVILPASVTDTDYKLTSVKVEVYHYETGTDLPYPLNYRDDLWACSNYTASCQTWVHVQNFSTYANTYGPFTSLNLVDVGGTPVINTIAKAKQLYIRLFYNPCYLTSPSGDCSNAGSDITGDGLPEQYSYAMYFDYAAVIIEYTKKNP